MTIEKDDLVRLANKQTATIDELMHENSQLRLENLALKASNASLVGTLEEVTEKQRGHVAQLKEFKAKLEALGAETRHQIELREDGFTIQHPLACRPYLFDCLVGLEARELEGLGDREPGRYYCRLDDQDELVIEERVPE